MSQCVRNAHFVLRFLPNPRPEVSRLFDAIGYLVLETPHAMQMKPSISKHAISLIMFQLLFAITPSNASIQLSCMVLHITVDSSPINRSSTPIASSDLSLLVSLSTSCAIS